MKTNSKTVLYLVACCSMLWGVSGADGDPLYQWNFNGGDGANTGVGAGGTLAANVGASFSSGSFGAAGVSGNAWDHAFYAYNKEDNWWGTTNGNAAAVGNVNLAGLTQFTITMWVKRGGANNDDLLNIGSTSTPDSTSNPGISIGLNGSWDNGIRVGVNGYNAWPGDLWGAGYNSEWVFLAVCYDGSGGVWYDPPMQALYGAQRNLAIITGGITTAASIAANVPFHIGDWGTPPGAPSVGATATAILANGGAGTTGFTGNLDDVRIYNGLLTVAQIEAVRQAAFAEPSPTVNYYWKGDVDGSWTSLNWTTDSDGLVAGGALPADGTAGVGFGTTGAANLTTDLGADQNVKGIVVTAGCGPVAIGGTHGLTVGANGIWLEQTAGSLDIDAGGGLALAANQIWKNKSPNSLTVESPLSGSGTLTKSGVGVLRLGGNNGHTGGTVVEQGTLVADHANALGAASASLAMNGGTLDLNGHDITLGVLSGNEGAVIQNSSGTPCALTLDVSSDSTYSCSVNDGPGGVPVSLVKKGAANVTSSKGSGFTGTVSIENGTFIANYPNYGGAPTTSSLGNAQVSGRTITVTSPGTLSLANNNIFGNQNANLTLLPAVVVNQTTVSATSYNLIGDVTLNAATLGQSTTNSGSYQGYQFKGVIRVRGTGGASTISGSGGNHLSANTVFDVGEVTGDAAADLIVSTPLINQSGDFGSAAGGLTKTGAGTMVLQGQNTYTGSTTVNQGTLSLQYPSLSDTAITYVAADATLDLNTGGATDTVMGLVIGGVTETAGLYRATDANGGSGAGIPVAGLSGTGKLNVLAPLTGYAAWSGNVSGQTPGEDFNGDGVENGIAYFMNDTGRISLPGIVGGSITWPNGGNIASTEYGSQFVVQTSSDLAAWTTVSASDSNLTNASDHVSYSLPTGAGKLFVRLVVIPN